MDLSKEELNRYSRHLILEEIGIEGQQKLKAAKVLVIGAGGLGCPILQYLAAAGVGKIGVIDMDVVEESNLQRQILYGVQDLGKNKANIAKERLMLLNPLINVEAYPFELNTSNALQLFKTYDLIIDGSDNFTTRYIVNDASVIVGKPLVYGSILKFEGQVSVFNYKNGPSYRCVFPEPPKPGEVPNCSEVGVLGVLTGIIGSLQANEALKIILGIGTSLSGKLLVYNALNCKNLTLNIEPDPILIQKTKELSSSFEQTDYASFCNFPTDVSESIKEITSDELLNNYNNYQLLDVREIWEQPRLKGQNIIIIPLPRLLSCTDQIPKDQPIVVICAKGIRSKIAIEQLQNQLGYNNLKNLTGGIKSLKTRTPNM
ncbi:molybdopterin-synthase adenylyltransferase MoeB [Aureispira]|nr:molybdopterin-synthase adenylyltransferase MoeB [Aureispira sp.]